MSGPPAAASSPPGDTDARVRIYHPGVGCWNFRRGPRRIIGENLLIPHKHYFNEIFPILNQVEVKAMAHITGGGILENPPRVLPDNCRIRLRKNSWVVPPIFSWLVKLGKLSEYEAYRTLNMGIGMLLIVSKDSFLQAVELLKQNQAEPYVIGEVIQGEKGVELIN